MDFVPKIRELSIHVLPDVEAALVQHVRAIQLHFYGQENHGCHRAENLEHTWKELTWNPSLSMTPWRLCKFHKGVTSGAICRCH